LAYELQPTTAPFHTWVRSRSPILQSIDPLCPWLKILIYDIPY
jgi:hypothetical protein